MSHKHHHHHHHHHSQKLSEAAKVWYEGNADDLLNYYKKHPLPKVIWGKPFIFKPSKPANSQKPVFYINKDKKTIVCKIGDRIGKAKLAKGDKWNEYTGKLVAYIKATDKDGIRAIESAESFESGKSHD